MKMYLNVELELKATDENGKVIDEHPDPEAFCAWVQSFLNPGQFLEYSSDNNMQHHVFVEECEVSVEHDPSYSRDTRTGKFVSDEEAAADIDHTYHHEGHNAS